MVFIRSFSLFSKQVFGIQSQLLARSFFTRQARPFSQDTAKNESKIELDYLLDDQAGIAVLSLNSPPVNGLSFALLSSLSKHITTLNNDPTVRTVIVRSLIPKFFSAGADLKERAKMSTLHQVATFVSTARQELQRLADLPCPTIAALDGYALGGGLELALACDLRIAADSAEMGLVETALAIIPGAGGTQRLPRVVGECKAKELMFTAQKLSGKEAHKIGLVNHSLPQNKDYSAAYNFALTLVDSFITKGPLALRMVKTAVNKGMQTDLQTGLAIEQACYAQVLSSEDRNEGLRAFMEKRKPFYSGQ